MNEEEVEKLCKERLIEEINNHQYLNLSKIMSIIGKLIKETSDERLVDVMLINCVAALNDAANGIEIENE